MPDPIGFIHYPGMRSRAFLGILLELGVEVSTVIEMVAEMPNLDAIRSEAARHGYDERFFDTALDLDAFLERSPSTRRIATGAKGINESQVAEALDKATESVWIFSGGGILKPHLFRPGRRLLHVHPGRIPDFRGSTCFYYSLLARGELAATCFELEAGLDCGQVLSETVFAHNLRVAPDMPLFMDSILDPWMRAMGLRAALSRQLPPQRTSPGEDATGNAYFVAHPFLRHLAIERLNSRFDPSRPEGVWTTSEGART